MSDVPSRGPGDYPDLVGLATRLFGMARDGRAVEVAAYVDAGVPVDLSNDKGDTLLMLAAYNGRPGVVRALVERGADVGRRNDRGQSPIAGAVFKGEDEIVHLLLAAGADPDAGTPSARATAEVFGQTGLLAAFDGPPS